MSVATTLTEQQAKTKWCPYSRTGMWGVAVNRHCDPKTVHDETRCLGSGCMAWRWAGIGTAPTVSGYCGLAGTPRSE